MFSVDHPVAVVSCIIEKVIDGQKHILLQTRRKPNTEYHNTLEIPAWRIEKYESVYDALKREVREETWLELMSIFPKPTENSVGFHDDKAFCFQAFCCQQQLVGGLPWIGFCFVGRAWSGELKHQESETRNPHRISVEDVQSLLYQTPERFFTLQLPFLHYYVEHHASVRRS